MNKDLTPTPPAGPDEGAFPSHPGASIHAVDQESTATRAGNPVEFLQPMEYLERMQRGEDMAGLDVVPEPMVYLGLDSGGWVATEGPRDWTARHALKAKRACDHLIGLHTPDGGPPIVKHDASSPTVT